MKVALEKPEKNVVAMEITVPAAQLDLALEKAVKKVANQVNIPGFRKGKVPKAVLENYVGDAVLLEEAAEIIVPEVYPQAVEENNVDVVDQPQVEMVQLEKGKDVIFKATVTVKPEVTLGMYQGVEVEKIVNLPTDEDVEKEIDHMRDRVAKMDSIADDAAIENGDTTMIDFQGFVDGEAFEGGSAEDYALMIGSNTFIPGFEEQMLGMKIGEERDVNVTFPEDYHKEDLAGKPACFKVKLRSARRKFMPELNDDFVKEVSEECDTVAQLKEHVQKDLTEKAVKDAEAKAKSDAVKIAMDNAEVDIPAVMIERRIDSLVEEFQQRLQYQGMSLDMFFQYTGSTMETLREQNRERAEVNVKQDLVLEAIVKAENIKPSEEDITKTLEEIAQAYNQPADKVREAFEKTGRMDYLLENLSLSKAMDFICDNAKINEK